MADANHQHAELRPGAALERRNSLVFRVTFASGHAILWCIRAQAETRAMLPPNMAPPRQPPPPQKKEGILTASDIAREFKGT